MTADETDAPADDSDAADRIGASEATVGALRVERTPTGRKRVRCSRCDEPFD